MHTDILTKLLNLTHYYVSDQVYRLTAITTNQEPGWYLCVDDEESFLGIYEHKKEIDIKQYLEN